MDATFLLSIRYDLHETGENIVNRIAHSGIFTDKEKQMDKRR